MDADFWLQKWELKKIAFHEPQVNPLLVRWFGELPLAKGSRVFLPLCGKTLDIAWLLSSGFRVTGVELSEIAIKELFLALGMTPKVTATGKMKHYAGESLDVYVGDFFDLSATLLGLVDAVYDRAALVALPEGMRIPYTSHLMEITNKAPQLVICFEYDQDLMAGPPFSIRADEMNRYYGGAYRLKSLATADIAGGLKGVCPAREHVWLLSND